MEESKAAAYYEELTRKGEGAARFKQGLGFSTGKEKDDNPTRGSALPSSSSFFSNFVKASSPNSTSLLDKQSQLHNIQNKLQKKPISEPNPSRVSDTYMEIERHSSSRPIRPSSTDRDRERRRRRRRKSSGSDSDEDRKKSRSSRSDSYEDRRRSSRSDSDEDRRRRRRRERRRSRSRSLSPRDRRFEKSGREERERSKGMKKDENEKKGKVDDSKLIEGYEKMTPAEKVKARMKLQLSETAEKDATKGMVSGWERFEFNKDAPLDDEEIEAAEDDAALVQHIGKSFRYSTVEARKEEEIKAAHDEAMFGASAIALPPTILDDEPETENNRNTSKESDPMPSLVNEKVLAKQQGSWRDRVRKA